MIIRNVNSPSTLFSRLRFLVTGFFPPRSNFKYFFSVVGIGNVSTAPESNESRTAVREHSFKVSGWLSKIKKFNTHSKHIKLALVLPSIVSLIWILHNGVKLKVKKQYCVLLSNFLLICSVIPILQSKRDRTYL